MEVSFQLEPSDIKSFDAYLKRRGPIPTVVSRILIVLFVGAAFVFQWVTQSYAPARQRTFRPQPDSWLPLVLSFGMPVLFVGIWLVIMFVVRRRQQQQLKANPLFTTRSLIAVSPEHFFHRNAGSGESKLFWSAIQSVGHDSNGVYFLLSENMGHIVPVRAFDSPESATRFFEYAERCWKIARGEEINPPIPAPPQPV